MLSTFTHSSEDCAYHRGVLSQYYEPVLQGSLMAREYLQPFSTIVHLPGSRGVENKKAAFGIAFIGRSL